MNRLSIVLATAVTALVLAAFACGPAAEPTPVPKATTAPAVQSPGSKLAANQVLRVNLKGEPAQLDPSRASWAQETTIVMQVFQGLLGFNQDLTLKPVVAREIPSTTNGGISADGLTYTFKLRPDVTWSDGKKVTAKDFEFGLKRTLDPTLAADYSSFYYDIKGGIEFNTTQETDAAKLKALRDAVAVKATDDLTLVITLTQPRFTFLQLMALWPAFPIREDIVQQHGDKWTEAATYIGNGPFKMEEWTHQNQIVLVRNENYWGTKPKLQKIVLKMVTDGNQELASYKNNEIEISTVPIGTEGAIMADPVLSKELVRYAELATYGLQFNVTKPPFDNVKVRQAISTAIDRKAFIDKVRSGVGKPATSWLPPGMPGYDAELGKEYIFDPAKAKQILTDAGFADLKSLPPISFQYANTATNKVPAEFIQAQLKQNLGIDVKLEPMEPKAFSQMVNGNQHTWALFGWGADYPDADNWLPEIFGTGGGLNHTLYSNKEFDDLAKKAALEPDTAKRLALWKQAHTIVVRDAPVIFMFYRERFVLVKPTVKDLITTGMDHQVSGDLFWDRTYLGE